ncbi:MAG: phage tail protein [bacterium]
MRATVDDLMQGFRFHASAVNEDGTDLLQTPERGASLEPFEGGGQAGFQSVTIPEISLEASEYREGTWTWTQKYAGPPTVSDCTLMRGVAKRDMAFYDWVMRAVTGEKFRSDVTIWHYQRAEMADAAQSAQSTDFRRVVCHNCIPMRVKPSADFDSMSGEVSLAEVDFALEKVELLNS